MPQQRCKRRERRQVGTGIGRHMRLGAGGPVEHPSWNLKPTVGIGTGQITAENDAARLLDSSVNADPKTTPWMPRVQQFPKLGSVGVSKPRCTIRRERICLCTRMRRSVDRSSERERLLLRRFCRACIIAIRGYDFQEGQARGSEMLGLIRLSWKRIRCFFRCRFSR